MVNPEPTFAERKAIADRQRAALIPVRSPGEHHATPEARLEAQIAALRRRIDDPEANIRDELARLLGRLDEMQQGRGRER